MNYNWSKLIVGNVVTKIQSCLGEDDVIKGNYLITRVDDEFAYAVWGEEDEHCLRFNRDISENGTVYLDNRSEPGYIFAIHSSNYVKTVMKAEAIRSKREDSIKAIKKLLNTTKPSLETLDSILNLLQK